jgi:uncharacterized membrane protein YdbT with pleckstrin-like domain
VNGQASQQASGKVSAQADEQELPEQDLSEQDPSGQNLDEQDLSEQELDALEDLASDELPVVLRTLGIVGIFLFIGPPLGGYTLLVIIFFMGVADHGIDWARLSDAFVGAMFFTAVFSYVFGGVLALLTGLMVALSRVIGGRTTILTPIFAAVAANGVDVLVNTVIATNALELSLPGKVPLTAGLLPSSIFAAILCWRLAKGWKLA